MDDFARGAFSTAFGAIGVHQLFEGDFFGSAICILLDILILFFGDRL